MTGPEPGDLAEIRDVVAAILEQHDLTPDGNYRCICGWDGEGRDLPTFEQHQADVLLSGPLSVVPTDSLEALLKMIETHGSMTPRPIRDAAAAVRSAITNG